MSTAFSQALNLKESRNQAAASGVGATTRNDVSESFGHDSLNQLSGVLSQSLGKEEGGKEVLASGSGGDESIDQDATVKKASF